MGFGIGIGIGWPNASAGSVIAPPTVVIGDQTWALKNLDVDTYADGTAIPQVTDPVEWAGLTTGAWCYYNNDPANGAIYGKLYNFYAISDPRGLAPVGYHVPTDNELINLITFLGGGAVAGGPLKEIGTTHWNSPNTNATNSSGFTSLPGGTRSNVGSFFDIYNQGMYWSSTQYDPNPLLATFQGTYYNQASTYRGTVPKKYGFSIRLIKN